MYSTMSSMMIDRCDDGFVGIMIQSKIWGSHP